MDFLSQVGVQIVGQVGQRPGQLQQRHHNDTTNDTTNNTGTTPQFFCNLGQIGDLQNKNDTANNTGPGRKPATNYIKEKKIDKTSPLPPPGGPVEVALNEKTKRIEQLAEKAVSDAMKKGNEIKNIRNYKKKVAENLGLLGNDELGKMTQKHGDDGTEAAIREVERTRNMLKLQEL